MEKGRHRFLMEIKGCTLERDGVGYLETDGLMIAIGAPEMIATTGA